MSRNRQFVAAALLLATLLAACQPVSNAAPPAASTPAAQAASAASTAFDGAPIEREANGERKRYSVVAYGYNYTDGYIDSFEVDGAGGGNLAVSTSTSPGGGHTCCARISSGTPPTRPIVILWTRDRKRWCELTVYLTAPVPIEPRYLEVHFYQDGHVEVAATQEASAPRLKLDRASYARRHETGNVNNDEKFARCRDGYRKEL
jgi:Protein of unknown function (DUF3304)